MEELDNIRNILKQQKISFNEKKQCFFFELEKRKIKILINKYNKIETRILDYDGLNPLCHVIPDNNEGLMCLDASINAYATDHFKVQYLQTIKQIILEENHLVDSFNELEINLIKELLFPFLKNINNSNKIKIIWEGFRFRNYQQLKKCLKNHKINWNEDNLIIFEYKTRKKAIFISRFFNSIFYVHNLYDVGTMIYKTGARVKKDILVILIGLGSLGSEIFERFRLSGYVNFLLIDNDTLNKNNDYRWAYPTIPLISILKVELINKYFSYLNIEILPKKIENINLKEITNKINEKKLNKLIFIDATAKQAVEQQTLKLWIELSKKYNFKASTYKLTFLEQHGLALHTFSINYSQDSPKDYFYYPELKKFSKNYNKERRILKINDEKYLFEQGCIGETQIYSQNSVKLLTIKARHLLQLKNEDDYTKINILTDLILEKENEWSDFYKKIREKEQNNDEIDIE